MPKTKSTIVDLKDLAADLELTQKRGYALANEEYLPGLNAIGAPIINIRKNEVVGAVSFDFPSLKFSIDKIEEDYADLVRQIAMDLSETTTVADD